ncbi:sulfotransferase [Nocardioides sp. CER19]|uniref:sulfotransferase n=1 Tax=Nocardioides sp. CER19 TaxID=3038538 RepID=UPI0024493057|nr:sulfotransferase [Nocardioides sp. CER19]MDH2415148.1 sulfotransferase [Nocardioides sp. CER19]
MRLALPRRRRFDPDYLFVVTFGRSGSTLVQGLLNAMPGTLVRGENGLFVHDLYRASAAAEAYSAEHTKHRSKHVTSAFYGVRWLRREPFVKATRQIADDVLLGTQSPGAVRRIGFKEVLWHRITPEETTDFFDWFEEAFPGARYILNTRDPEAASRSGFWQHAEPGEAEMAIARVREIQDYLLETRPDRTFVTRYESLTSDDRAESDAVLTGLARFVTGGCDEALLGRLREVLTVGHGPIPFGKPRGAASGDARG